MSDKAYALKEARSRREKEEVVYFACNGSMQGFGDSQYDLEMDAIRAHEVPIFQNNESCNNPFQSQYRRAQEKCFVKDGGFIVKRAGESGTGRTHDEEHNDQEHTGGVNHDYKDGDIDSDDPYADGNKSGWKKMRKDDNGNEGVDDNRQGNGVNQEANNNGNGGEGNDDNSNDSDSTDSGEESSDEEESDEEESDEEKSDENEEKDGDEERCGEKDGNDKSKHKKRKAKKAEGVNSASGGGNDDDDDGDDPEDDVDEDSGNDDIEDDVIDSSVGEESDDNNIAKCAIMKRY